MEATKPRVSLSKKQLATDAGLELLSICQSVTSDGVVADEEIHALRQWLDVNQDAGIPAISFLITTVDHVLADGVVTADERKAVAKAVEAILPPEERKYAGLLRRQVEQEGRAAAKAAAAAEKSAKKAEREKLRPLVRADFMVAGTRYEGRSAVIEMEVEEGDEGFLLRDPTNAHSRFAVKVLSSSGSCVGYVPEEYAVDLAPVLDQGATHRARFKKILNYRSGPVPVLVAELFAQDAPVEGVASQGAAAAKESAAARASKLSTFIVVALIVAFIYWIAS